MRAFSLAVFQETVISQDTKFRVVNSKRSSRLWYVWLKEVGSEAYFVEPFGFPRPPVFSVTALFLHCYLLTYLLTYSMEEGPSWEASYFAAGQEIPCILWNPKVPHRTHKRQPPVPILSQPNPVLIP